MEAGVRRLRYDRARDAQVRVLGQPSRGLATEGLAIGSLGGGEDFDDVERLHRSPTNMTRRYQ